MPVIGCCDDDGINGRVLEEFPEIFFNPGARSLMFPGFFDGTCCLAFIDIADRQGRGHPRLGEVSDMAAPHSAGPYDAKCDALAGGQSSGRAVNAESRASCADDRTG